MPAITGLLAVCVRFLTGRDGGAHGRVAPAPDPAYCPAFTHVYGLTKKEAEDLLDWLEGQATADRQVSYTSEKGFCVSYRTRVNDEL
jgi:hypothetical protein